MPRRRSQAAGAGERGRSNMAVTIYFKDGQTAQMSKAVKVEEGNNPTVANTSRFVLRCLDADGHEIGRFDPSELRGYTMSEVDPTATGRAPRRQTSS
jgi:hypothetical protein